MLKKIIGLLISMCTVFKHLFKKAVTLEYPEKKIIPPENFRGKPFTKNCIKCLTCTKVCPTDAIKIEDNKFNIDLNKCIFCGNCAYYCPINAIKMSNEYELAVNSKTNLVLSYDIEERRTNDLQ